MGSLISWNRPFPGVLLVGWILGFLPALMTYEDSSAVTLTFRILILPLLVGFCAWAAFILLAYLWGVKAGPARPGPTLSASARQEFILWTRRLRRRIPWVLFALLLGLASMGAMGIHDDACKETRDYLLTYRAGNSRGITEFHHGEGNWVSPSYMTRIVPRLSFNSGKNPEYRKDNYNLRYLGLIRTRAGERVNFKLGSDDGSLPFAGRGTDH